MNRIRTLVVPFDHLPGVTTPVLMKHFSPKNRVWDEFVFGGDYRGEDMRGSKFRRCTFRDANLCGVNFDDCAFYGCEFHNCRWDGPPAKVQMALGNLFVDTPPIFYVPVISELKS